MPAVTSCPRKCVRDQIQIGRISWSQMSIVTTITAETQIVVVNHRTNKTITSTIYNTDASDRSWPRPQTNSAGTAIASVISMDGEKTSYRTVQYPTTAYNDYSSTYPYCGNLPKASAGATGCSGQQSCIFSEAGFLPSVKDNAPIFTLPSHPPIPDGIQPGLNTLQDPRGLTYQGVLSPECDDTNIIEPLFPGLDLWSCEALDQCPKDYTSNHSTMTQSLVIYPNIALQAALYLTTKYTSTEAEATTPANRPEPTMDQSPPVSQPASIPKQTPSNEPPEQNNPPPPALPAEESDLPAQNVPNAPQSHEAAPNPPNNGLSQNQALGPTNGAVSEDGAPRPQGDLQPHNGLSNPSSNARSGSGATDSHGNTLLESGSQSVSGASVQQAGSQQGPGASVPQGNPQPENGAPILQGNTQSGNGATGNQDDHQAEGQTPPPAGQLPQIAYMPIVATSTNAQGIAAPYTQGAAAIPVLVTSTGEDGKNIIGTSFSTVPISASVPTALAFTNAQGDVISTTSYQPAIALTTTNAQGSRITTTSALTASPQNPDITSPPTLTIGGQTVLANPLGQYIINDQTLTPGGIVTISRTRISLSPDEASLVVGSSVELLSASTAPVLTIGSQTITANSLGQYIIDGQTLSAGGVITVSGTRISLTPDKTAAVIGTSTEVLTTGTSAVAGGTNSSSAFTGGAKSMSSMSGKGGLSLGLLLVQLGFGVVRTML
ncbi:hypothetical protein ACLMJK_003567 [Lecanora helva]